MTFEQYMEFTNGKMPGGWTKWMDNHAHATVKKHWMNRYKVFCGLPPDLESPPEPPKFRIINKKS